MSQQKTNSGKYVNFLQNQSKRRGGGFRLREQRARGGEGVFGRVIATVGGWHKRRIRTACAGRVGLGKWCEQNKHTLPTKEENCSTMKRGKKRREFKNSAINVHLLLSF